MTRCVLLIDDDQEIREVAQLALSKFGGWQATLAASGREGLEKAGTYPFEAILLDVSMPEMDGFTVFDQLKANPSTQKIPIVLLTAKVLPSDRRRFAEMGVAGVITKPFDPVTLCAQVTKLLGW